jgi:hypothetical protein
MWKLVFNVVGVIFKFESCKKITHKVHKNNAPSKISKNMLLGPKKLEKKRENFELIWTYENMVRF